MKTKPKLNLQTTIIILVCGVVIAALFVTYILITVSTTERVRQHQADKATYIARTIAYSPFIIDALQGKGDKQAIQEFAEKIRIVNGVEFIVIMDMNAIRLSHPDPAKIGKKFVGGDEQPVLKGKENISIATGTLGTSLRSFTPIFSTSGKQVGAVAVGISLINVAKALSQSRDAIYIGTSFGVIVGIMGAWVLARKVKRIMFGMEPSAIAKQLEERNAMLESTREGILAVDVDNRITLVNSEAIRLFNRTKLVEDPVGKNIEEYMPNSRLPRVLHSGKEEYDQEFDLHGLTLLVNRVPVYVNGKIVGAIATFRDKTEVKVLAEQLTGVRQYADALRAQSHEFMNKLHVILGMVQMGFYDELPGYISGIASKHQTEIGFIVKHIKDPVMAGFLLGKLSSARESGVELKLAEESYLPETDDSDIVHEMVTIAGNLIENAIEAVHRRPVKRITIGIFYDSAKVSLQVSDTGKGIPEHQIEKIFEHGFSTKGTNRGTGLFLVARSVQNMKGSIEVSSQLGEGTTFIVRLPFRSKGEGE